MQESVRALVLTDVVDSTRLAEELGDVRTAEVWSAHDRLARDLLAQHGGREVDKTDGFLLLFDSVRDAAEYALAHHRALRSLSADADVELAARIGFHVGGVVLRENSPADVARGAKPLEVEGVAKPTAARIMAMALGGQTLLSDAARHALGDDVPAGAELESRGHWRVKGIAEPLHVHELGERGEAPFTPPPDGDKAYRVVEQGELWLPVREVPRSLPAEKDTFVGREAELQELAHRFDEDARLVTVLGPGGTGKTRLVTRHAWTWLGDYPGGAWFCDLSEARSLDGIVHALAATLDVPLCAGDPVVQLGHAIAGRGRCLVVLDNFEQVAEHAEATVAKWLDRASGAHFVVTSRVLLGLHAESVMNVEPLAVEGPATLLFELRARSKKPGFAVTDENREHVQEVVRLLDGLPLAIELASARIRVLSPAKLLDRMKHRFELLSGASSSGTRQATLQAAIDWSWNLLEPWEQAALAQASVFEGGFSLEAAEAVLDLSRWDEAPWSLDAVQALVDKSLLRTWAPEHADPRHDIEEPYFGMYVSIHEYASEKLRTAGAIAGGGSGSEEEHEAFVRHGEHYATFGAVEALASLDTHGGVERRRSVELELDNFVAACRRAVARGDAATAVPAFAAAAAVLKLKGPVSTSTELGRQVVAMDSLGRPERGRALIVLGGALRLSGRREEARALFDEALAISRELGEREAEGRVLNDLGSLLGHQSPEEALACFERALEIHRDTRGRLGEALALGGLALIQSEQGHPDAVRARYEEALAIHREIGNRRGEGVVLGNLGNLRRYAGDVDGARTCYEQALAAHGEVGDRVAEGRSCNNLGLLSSDEGQLDEALSRYVRALELSRSVGDRHVEAYALMLMASVLERQGRVDEARSHHERALAIAREIDDRLVQGMVLGNLGGLLRRQGRLVEALPQLERALELDREVGNKASEGVALIDLGRLHAQEGRADEAQAAFAAGEVSLHEVEAWFPLGLLHAARGLVTARAGDETGARAALAEAESLAERCHATAGSELGRVIAELRDALGEAGRGSGATSSRR